MVSSDAWTEANKNFSYHFARPMYDNLVNNYPVLEQVIHLGTRKEFSSGV